MASKVIYRTAGLLSFLQEILDLHPAILTAMGTLIRTKVEMKSEMRGVPHP